MANIGSRKPYVAQRKADGTYETPATVGYAVETTITPQYAEAELYGDDKLVDSAKEFTKADITMGVTHVPREFHTAMFGHTKETSGEIAYGVNDEANEVGYGFIGVERIDGKKSYVGTFCPRCKFSEPESTASTKNESITYNTPSISGTAFGDDDNNWKYDNVFDTEALAEAYILSKFGVNG